MKFVRVVLTLGLLFAMASPALAHRINIFALDEGGEVYTESTFAGKRPVKKGTVRVFNADGTLLLTKETDEKGICTFPRPEPGILTVEVDAGQGHKNRWELDAVEGGAVSAEPAVAEPVLSTPKAPAVTGLSPSDWQQMEQVVDAAVAKALHQAKEETRLQDIVGGLGYIVGLFGFAAWGRSRREAA
ncbi:hypothetical protein DSLASN_45190 [Desulfoluna limicola]|uniref:Nickel transport protein n=1 Tax=Desulfoluna limicola TaxID=2810562 RepID=A0ABM7PNL8_9BACT|nr:hypothetical protein [Desulfoluna limicola]BCS98887.1 hypothetical protein DSLASN_45190 [Desulfoluna limicola]